MDKSNFIVGIFHEYSNAPIVSFAAVRVYNPDVEIEQLNVQLDGENLPLWNSTPERLKFGCWIPAHGGANFRIPATLTLEANSIVQVFDGSKLLRTIRGAKLRVGGESYV
jgi:hypothetical protein